VGDHDRAVLWRISGSDLQEHGFYEIHEGVNVSEALCTHSVPSDRLVEGQRDGIAAPRCVACLLIHGNDLADRHGDLGDAARYQG
jgi:hypothetical protein